MVLQRSIWNTRTWTYQEYVSAGTVQFYTEDWKPYLGLTLHSHKDSPTIISVMQQVAGGLTRNLTIFRPDLGRLPEKLYVASMRQTTVVEDIAYSFLGIFNASIRRGQSGGRSLLDHVLSGSREVSILAWTGHSGGYNSCLPMNLTVYGELVPPHIPQPIGTAEVDATVAILHSSLPDVSLAVKLYLRLNELASSSFAGSRLQLPCIT